MNIDMNVMTNRFTGKQKLEYWNNSPDTLTRVFYHLYFNAFQPGSMMDMRSRRQGSIQIGRGQDWDPRVRDRIANPGFAHGFQTGSNVADVACQQAIDRAHGWRKDADFDRRSLKRAAIPPGRPFGLIGGDDICKQHQFYGRFRARLVGAFYRAAWRTENLI